MGDRDLGGLPANPNRSDPPEGGPCAITPLGEVFTWITREDLAIPRFEDVKAVVESG